MHRLMTIAVVMFAFAACAVLGGCSTTTTTTPKQNAPVASQEGAKQGGAETVPPGTEAKTPEQPAPRRSTGPGAGDYVMTVPKNIVYVPWKIIAGAFKGAGDGVGAGCRQGTMPALGILFSPLNLVVGFVTGFFEGLAADPCCVGPSDDFSRAMSAPMKRDTTIWWYPQ